jgi:hypothetical protein
MAGIGLLDQMISLYLMLLFQPNLFNLANHTIYKYETTLQNLSSSQFKAETLFLNQSY